MKLEIEYITYKTKKINFNYNYYLTSAIYSLISEHNEEFSKLLHDQGFMMGNKKFKLFVYSRLIPERYTVDGNSLVINKGITRLYINSPIKEFINSLGNSLVKRGGMKIGDEEFKVNNIYLKDNPVFNYETKFITLSPIVVTTGVKKNGCIKPRTVEITEKKFVDNIKKNLLNKFFLLHGKLPDNMNIEISFDQEYIKKHRRGTLINFKGITVKGFIAPFTMKCTDDIKKIAIDCGIGENNSIGMGYIMEK